MERKWNYYKNGSQNSARNTALANVWNFVSTYANPKDKSGEDAWVVLDEYARRFPSSVAAAFYGNCSDHQSDLFVSEWESKWRNLEN